MRRGGADRAPHTGAGRWWPSRLLPRDDRGRAVGDQRRRVRGADGHGGALHAVPVLLPLPAGPAPAVVWPGVREAAGDLAGGPLQRHPQAGRGDRRGDPGGGRHRRAARGLAGRGAPDHRRARGAADRGRDWTGFGRTGTMFACEARRRDPGCDRAVKASGDRLSAVGDRLRRGAGHVEPGAHIGTFRGHQVAMAAGAEAIEFMVRTDLPRHAGAAGRAGARAAGAGRRGDELPAIGRCAGAG
jgi:hypothetical protein